MITRKKLEKIGADERNLRRYSIVDIHTHILPGIDDGSESPEQSAAMLEALRSQGIETVVATPHYYPSRESFSSFLEKRNRAAQTLDSVTDDTYPKLILGAEVLYYRGISRSDALEEMCIQGTKLLLLEMSTGDWSEYVLREVADISNTGVTVVLAHVDRYFDTQPKAVFDSLSGSGVLMQANADSLMSPKSAKRVLNMLGDGQIQFIGSDCHNPQTRAPLMRQALQIIDTLSGEDTIERLTKYSKKFF